MYIIVSRVLSAVSRCRLLVQQQQPGRQQQAASAAGGGGGGADGVRAAQRGRHAGAAAPAVARSGRRGRHVPGGGGGGHDAVLAATLHVPASHGAGLRAREAIRQEQRQLELVQRRHGGDAASRRGTTTVPHGPAATPPPQPLHQQLDQVYTRRAQGSYFKTKSY